MSAPIDIVQNAMIHVGLEPIESFEDGTPNADSAKRLWPTHRLTLLAHTDWHFARKFQQLSRTAAAPAGKWSYAFRQPPDMVRPPAAFYLSDDPAQPAYQRFEQVGAEFLSDVDVLFAAFTCDLPEAKWPGFFVAFAEHSFAAIIGRAGGALDSRIGEEHQIAWGVPSDGMRGGLSRAARSADGKNTPTRSLIRNRGPLIGARLGSR